MFWRFKHLWIIPDAGRRRLPALFRDLAEEFGAGFLDAGTVAAVSAQDGVHLTPEGHIALAEAMAAKLRQDFAAITR